MCHMGLYYPSPAETHSIAGLFPIPDLELVRVRVLRMISHKNTISPGLTRSGGWVSSLVSFIFDRNGKRKQETSTGPTADRSAAEKGRKGGGLCIQNKYRADDLKIFPAKPLKNLADGRGYSAATRPSQEKETYIESVCYAHAKFLKQPGFFREEGDQVH